ncbi:MAG: hypothetical protein A3F04_01925 [Candidatus Chisholmbacteria bacterium RIFCSPHIGHO2_12_FULL_49_9]|uniref:DUF4446 domain-containing protein n=1 Tax=Candidatus Chisholmbacteria bacterium RIFCSPHIGHO2_01_FULL_52_32 TaxID=1797591 RepID=A0A1G1VTS6_9BACT|nr:MAG: hypothetical protein A3F04_01925 [Candidatus Chisholmbacteria bacterium RIFCSPHIGHO2_12_FULL_49_9]OGY18782.1 MAG: hypothetical protein A2786_04785 [Candidatus Chisholmbacteria bacterium RIFCSPHIGHO2_01_FULL_52_32]OGY19848.1 MAG: hypothetical protein A2900_01960 [Candidatus Chisholmbacteria bacterium RIFCSPLOWO2_01_FULL_50_28]
MVNNPTLLNFLFTFLVLWLLIVSILLWQNIRHYNRLAGGVKKQELREILEHLLSQLKENKRETKELRQWLKSLEEEEKFDLKKVGFIRFNPFSDTGGNQSFCLALLDGHDNGIVISSLHSRDQTRVYAKAITQGKTEGQQLSRDEKEAIQTAQEMAKG